jgi:hypothetical protein|tara:strand:- start:37269 stop:38216 length:948 start_codon:yes stop_codon:yes gene_type:complete
MSSPFNFRGRKFDLTREHIFYYGEVIDDYDPLGTGRVRVRIKQLDKDYSDSELPWCFPLMPRFFNVVPQKGEGVRLLMYTIDKNKSDINRSYIGPLIGQDQQLHFQDKRTALGTQSDVGGTNALKSTDYINSAKGVYASPYDVAIQGRDNADIILTSAKIDLRAGKFVPGNPVELNRDNPARIQLIHVNDKESVATILANTINLVSYTGQNNGEGTSFNKLQNNGLDSSGSSLQKYLGGNRQLTQDGLPIGGELHPLVYGDRLIEFCKLVQKFVSNHTHPYGQMVPDVATDDSDGITEISKFNFSSMISHRIRIN